MTACTDCDRRATTKGRCPAHYRSHRYATEPEYRAARLLDNRIRSREKYHTDTAYREDVKRKAREAYYVTRWLRYGLTAEKAAALVEGYGGKCPVCLRVPAVWAVDHDHACCPGKFSCGSCVRGLLCRPCNRGLGYIGDTHEAAVRLVSYLANQRGN